MNVVLVYTDVEELQIVPCLQLVKFEWDCKSYVDSIDIRGQLIYTKVEDFGIVFEKIVQG